MHVHFEDLGIFFKVREINITGRHDLMINREQCMLDNENIPFPEYMAS